MIALTCDKVSLAFGVKSVLENVSFSVQMGEKLGIVGVNGAGKSTLFSIIMGETEPDSGSVYTAKGTSIGYLAQNAVVDSDRTLYEEMLDARRDMIEMENDLQ